MTKKDYELIAQILKTWWVKGACDIGVPREQYLMLVDTLGLALAGIHKGVGTYAFNRARFREACFPNDDR
jgi:hypothetical protein